MVVVEPRHRLARRQPDQLVDLVVGREGAVDDRHPPVADELRTALAIAVARRRQLLAELASQAGLLLDLAQRRGLERLARVELALRQRPVVVARPVDQRDLGSRPAVAQDDSPRRLDLPACRRTSTGGPAPRRARAPGRAPRPRRRPRHPASAPVRRRSSCRRPSPMPRRRARHRATPTPSSWRSVRTRIRSAGRPASSGVAPSSGARCSGRDREHLGSGSRGGVAGPVLLHQRQVLGVREQVERVVGPGAVGAEADRDPRRARSREVEVRRRPRASCSRPGW